jgi:hypothetical protein
MATLKQVQEAQSSTETPTLNELVGTNSGSSFSSIIDTDTMPQRQYVVFRLVRKKQRRLWLDGICDNCYNPKTKETERTYLVRGTKSIWQSDLTDLIKDMDKPNSYISKNRIGLLFEDGICRIPITEKNQLEFARVNTNNVGKSRNGAGKYSFYEYDAQSEQALRLEKQMHRIKMITKANEMDEGKVKKVAVFMGISLVDELGYPKTPDGIKSELMIKADLQPEAFERLIDSKEVEVSWMVRKAILDAKIDLTAQQGTALWAGGKGFIGKVPSNRKAYEYLTELAMTNSDEGRQFLEQLKTIAT